MALVCSFSTIKGSAQLLGTSSRICCSEYWTQVPWLQDSTTISRKSTRIGSSRISVRSLAIQATHGNMWPTYKKPLVVVLMPVKDKCVLCAANLKLRRDQPAPVVVYNDTMGSVPGSHFHRYCTNRSCGCTQYYGYYIQQEGINLHHKWFLPTTGKPYHTLSHLVKLFSMMLLKRFHSEILLGQLSFMQCTNIYNHINKCDWPLSGKECR